MKKFFLVVLLVMFFAVALPWLGAQTICHNAMGPHGDYIYKYWRAKGEGCMILGPKGTFSVEWETINDMIAQTGVQPGTGNEIIKYAAEFNPNGNSFMSVFGYTENPYVKYYIMDSWGAWKPPGSEPLGNVESDGEIYDIYKVQQYKNEDHSFYFAFFNVRREKRSKGTITLSNHVNAWKNLDMELGDFTSVSFAIEGYQSSGYANIYELSIIDSSTVTKPSLFSGDVNGDRYINIIDALLMAQYYVGIPLVIFIEDNGDVNDDGEITIVDALLIAQCYVGQRSCYYF